MEDHLSKMYCCRRGKLSRIVFFYNISIFFFFYSCFIETSRELALQDCCFLRCVPAEDLNNT